MPERGSPEDSRSDALALTTRLVMPVSYDVLQRLHGDACATCGRVDGLMRPTGLMFTTDGEGHRYGWPVRACVRHRSGAAL